MNRSSPPCELGHMGGVAASPRAHQVVFLLVEDFDLLALAGCWEVFALATRLRRGVYAIEAVAAKRAGASDHGLVLAPRTYAEFDGEPGTLVVVGGAGVYAPEGDEELQKWLVTAARSAERIVSVSTGTFLLARAGLLDGRRATTHWAAARELERRYPAIEVDHDAVFVRDGNLYTSGAPATGIDLVLALIEDDLGQLVALELARSLGLFVRRVSGQSQLSPHLAAAPADPAPIAELQHFIAANLGADLSVAALARHVIMSPRNLTRVFLQETGTTPAAYVEALRLDAARRALEETAAPVASIASACGFASAQRMRRVFLRRLGVTPSEFRRRVRGAVRGAGASR